MPDTRTKEQKLRAMADPKNGATQGERDNADALLARLFPVDEMYAGKTFIRWGSKQYVLEVRRVTRGPAIGSLYLFCPCPAWRFAAGKGDICKHAKDVLANELRGHYVQAGAVLR